MNTGHMDSKVEVAVGLVVTMWTWDIKNLVVDPFHVSLHVLFTGEGFVTPVAGTCNISLAASTLAA